MKGRRDDTMVEADELTALLTIAGKMANRLYDGEPIQANLLGKLVADINASRDSLIAYKESRRRWIENC